MNSNWLSSLLVLVLASAPSCIAVASHGKPTTENTTVREVLPLRYASCDDLVPMLRDLIPANQARILSDSRTNSLVVLTDKATLEELQRLVAKLDVEVK